MKKTAFALAIGFAVSSFPLNLSVSARTPETTSIFDTSKSIVMVTGVFTSGEYGTKEVPCYTITVFSPSYIGKDSVTYPDVYFDGWCSGDYDVYHFNNYPRGLTNSTVIGMPSERLHVGDFFTCDDYQDFGAEYSFQNAQYIGNGLDIFGEDFMKVLRDAVVFNFEKPYSAGEIIQNDNLSDISIVKGDATEDENVNIVDVIAVNKNILGKETFSAYAQYVADVNQNGTVDSGDSLEILKYVVGLNETL